MKHLYFFLIVSFCSSLLSCTNDDSFLAHDFETQQNRALSIYTGNYNIYQIAKKVSLPSASTTKLNSVITNCCNDYPVIKWLHNYAKDKKYNFSDVNITSKGMNGNPAAYDHSTKILSFLTSNAINNTTYPEEFIHMNQDNVYFGGIGTYEKTAMLNIEFESKFIQDVIHAPYGTQLVGSGNKYYNSYINWVYSFNPTSSFPNFTAVESGYNNISWWQFAQDFKESSPSPYKDYVMSNVLVAKLIDIIGNNFGKNTKSIALASSKNSTILPQSFKYKGKTPQQLNNIDTVTAAIAPAQKSEYKKRRMYAQQFDTQMNRSGVLLASAPKSSEEHNHNVAIVNNTIVAQNTKNTAQNPAKWNRLHFVRIFTFIRWF